jgi:hypothetical protein
VTTAVMLVFVLNRYLGILGAKLRRNHLRYVLRPKLGATGGELWTYVVNSRENSCIAFRASCIDSRHVNFVRRRAQETISKMLGEKSM